MICQRLSRLPMCAGDCVGIAFQSLKSEEAENISYIIPTPGEREHMPATCTISYPRRSMRMPPAPGDVSTRPRPPTRTHTLHQLHTPLQHVPHPTSNTVIEHFIRDYEVHGRYTGFPGLGVEWQKMESPVLRAALGLRVRTPRGLWTLVCVCVWGGGGMDS
jgi:hypothetical protein